MTAGIDDSDEGWGVWLPIIREDTVMRSLFLRSIIELNFLQRFKTCATMRNMSEFG